MMRLGIDTGGTYTDAVLLAEDDRVVAAAKALTTHGDLFSGIAEAVRTILAEAPEAAARRVSLVGLSTTLATNALVEGKGGRPGLVLIGLGPESLAKGGLAAALGKAPRAFVGGGHDAYGKEHAPLDVPALDAAIEAMRDSVDGFAVTAAFAVRNPAHEQAAAARIAALTGAPVTLSSELTSRLDAPRRALTTLLNARLIPTISRLLDDVERLLAEVGVQAPLMVVRGDGALMAAAVARARPVETILSGPAASVVGAAHLSGLADAMVSDVGGTTTDVAILEGGRPRLAMAGARVGGHRTMVEAIDLVTSGLGGDSEVGRDAAGALTLGPRRLVPLALLAHQHPALCAALEAEVARGVPRPTDARIAVRLGLDHAPQRRSRSQQRLLALLDAGPQPLSTVVDREHLAIPLVSLTAHGVVAVAGFTPSDAAHLLGLQSGWAVEAARLGAVLEARKTGFDGPPEAFARLVLEAARTASVRALVEAAWGASGGASATLEALLPDPLFSRTLAGDAPGGPLALGLTLDRAIVAVGGPAGIFYEGVAERLGSRLVLPPHHQVCNAIGAVVGEVVRHVERVASRVSEERLALYLDDRVLEIADPAAARQALEADAHAAALAAARAAGAIDPVVTICVAEDRAAIEGGADLVMEIRVRATARGRPRQAVG
jgi:N-methylhydantoinase A/oxoprolinase/acetone carboxylase beta subunit